LHEFVRAVAILCQILIGIIIVRAILSWFNIRRDNPIIVILSFITDPILDPLRRVIPRVDSLDLTPMIAILILWLIYWLLTFLVLD
jgi:YggT family protein